MIRTFLRKVSRFVAVAAVFSTLGVGGTGAGDGGLLAAKTMTPKPGTVFRDCPECPELIVVPAGIFVMGSNKTRKTEKPAHRVNFKRPFAIGRFEVTFDQWLVCVAEKGCRHQPHDHNWGRKSRPVINITWDQAKNYLKWLSRKTGQTYRLPTEAEWEYVHRAGTRSKFWWGEETGNKMANCRDCESRQCCSAKDHSCCSHETKPVGSFGPNPFGVFDTARNAFEWVEDCWNADHRGAPADGTARETGNCRFRVIRGGSFYYFSKVSQGTYRAKNPRESKAIGSGSALSANFPEPHLDETLSDVTLVGYGQGPRQLAKSLLMPFVVDLGEIPGNLQAHPLAGGQGPFVAFAKALEEIADGNTKYSGDFIEATR